MARFSIQLLLLFFIVSFCVFFGVELAKQGIEEIHGPLETGAEEISTSSEIQSENQKSDDEISAEEEEDSPRLSLTTPTEESSGLSVKIGNVLQSTAHKGIEVIVSVFHALFS
ncbi:DUF3679 domain-containing protein [Chengkuizengella sediminis]|uniref:DUF3679 domain-containing protein n=1 Tax=Chengkuizengella sediminis TaxID=1885917 RepID=UPI00138943ED|nr:DUF3679 domain-containing protein [Chengkuizengella sediminis]NDI33758.1 DUF3679 domain-containing protein [Chengkuizengella sediminis]